MKRVELYGRVRHAVLVEGMSRREAARVFGIARRTVEKMLVFSVPPGYHRGARKLAASPVPAVPLNLNRRPSPLGGLKGYRG